jgi:hypothetical protein
MRLAHDSDAASLPAAVLWKRALLCLGRKKNWRARKAGRAARKKFPVGDMALALCFCRVVLCGISGTTFGPAQLLAWRRCFVGSENAASARDGTADSGLRIVTSKARQLLYGYGGLICESELGIGELLACAGKVMPANAEHTVTGGG